MSGERILLEHVIKSGIELVLSHLPSDQRTLGEVGGQQRLAHAPNDTTSQHGLNALEHRRGIQAALLGDLADRIVLKPLEPILGNLEDAGVDRVLNVDRDGGASHVDSAFVPQ